MTPGNPSEGVRKWGKGEKQIKTAFMSELPLWANGAERCRGPSEKPCGTHPQNCPKGGGSWEIYPPTLSLEHWDLSQVVEAVTLTGCPTSGLTKLVEWWRTPLGRKTEKQKCLGWEVYSIYGNCPPSLQMNATTKGPPVGASTVSAMNKCLENLSWLKTWSRNAF